MPEEISKEETERWHRRFAATCNNAAWDLASKQNRTPDEDREMVASAYASAFHWSKIGKPVNQARADVTLAHVHSLLGNADLALKHAKSCLAFVSGGDCEDWDVAFAHAEMAHAAAAARDGALHAKHYALAKQTGEAIKDEEDRRVFLEEFAKIPKEVAERSA